MQIIYIKGGEKYDQYVSVCIAHNGQQSVLLLVVEQLEGKTGAHVKRYSILLSTLGCICICTVGGAFRKLDSSAKGMLCTKILLHKQCELIDTSDWLVSW